MQFLKDLNTFHIDGKEIPCIAASGAPDDHYPGATGVLYMDSSTGKLYLCTDANTIQKRYSWRIVGDVDTTEVRQAVESYFAQNMIDAAGLTSEEKNLMLALFKAVPYTSDVSATMKSLEAIWNSGAGGDEGGDAPGVTYYAVTYNLTSITADSTPASVIEGGSLTVNLTPDTNAVLGEVAVTMGGVDVTASVYSNGKISISSVTGDVVITAVATVASYTQVEYLEANNNTHSGIITDYIPSNTDLVEGEFSCVTGAVWAYLFSWNALSTSTRMLVSRFDDVAGRTAFTCMPGYQFGGTANDPDPNFVMPRNTNGVWRFAQSEPGSCTIYDADGNERVTLTDVNAASCAEPCAAVGVGCFFEPGGMRGNTGAAGLRIHSFKIKDAYGNTTLDLIPVLDENDVPCMYDKVSGKYYYCPNGNEYFTAGGAV